MVNDEGKDGELTPEEKLAQEEASKQKTAEEEKLREEEEKLREEEEKLQQEKEKQDADEKPSKSIQEMQKRISDLTATIYDLQERLNESATSKVSDKKGTTWDDYSDAELKALGREKPEYEETVNGILEQRRESRIMENIRSESARDELARESLRLVQENFPKYLEKGTKEYDTAIRIFNERGFGSRPDGTYLAAVLADKELNRGKPTKTTQLEKQLEKERAKKDLAGGRGGRPEAGIKMQVEKAFEKAQGTKPGSPEWKAYLKLQREAKEERG